MEEFTFEVDAGQLTPGRKYVGKLVELERWMPEDENPKYPLPKDKDGNPIPKVRFTFEATEGEEAGCQAGRICNALWSPKAALRKLVEGMLGHKLTRGERVNLKELVDQSFEFFVTETEGGEGVKVEQAYPYSELPV